jgi:2-polyprenyl-3-methyl-5-hydroxy-6-metoxy-1,4-benzoquinol methylase
MKIECVGWHCPEFETKAWVSQSAKEYWEPRFATYSDLILDLEVLSVVHDYREIALQIHQSKDLPRVFKTCTEFGLKAYPVEFNAGAHRIFITKNIPLSHFLGIWRDRRGWRQLSNWLGYPDCCSSWFDDLWNAKRQIDTTIQMANGKTDIPVTPTHNIILRNFGIRSVFHLPCSFDCLGTLRVFESIKKLAEKIGRSETFDEMYQCLRWPVKFSSLHGVAEITTPVVKLRRNTDTELTEKIVNYYGDVYPEFGASGIRFPFEKRKVVQIIRSQKNTWTLNGFSSRIAMDSSHDMILTELARVIDKTRDMSVIDLGCGTGELLRKIHAAYPNVKLYGVESDMRKVIIATGNVEGATIKKDDATAMKFDQMYDICLVSTNRLEEAKRSGNEHFWERLNRYCKYIILYSYDNMKIETVNGGDANV